jgi:assimilatory nitrate reductase electron transfer subunit
MSCERVVVIGAGMVGHRFVDELVRADPGGRFAIELVGEEEYEPYNRILLSEVVAGRADLKALVLPLPNSERVTFRRGVAATAIDRDAGRILLADGTTSEFDRVVLATGARAFVPPIRGLSIDGQSHGPRHVHVLRNLDDCRNIAARAMNAKHAVVLGGGVLGLEAACGLRRRGVPVTVVDLDDHLMATQLDGGPSRMLASRLRELGIDVLTGVTVAEVISAYDEIVAVRLTDDRVLAADLMLVSCGVRANIALAEQAGLVVDRGIVVDEDLTTTDARVHAIGDCAQAPSGMTGLLAPGWRQADQLVHQLLGGSAGVDRPSEDEGVKLKAAGVDLITRGVRASRARDDDRVLTVQDSGARRYVDLVVREDKLVGITVLGMPEVSASLTVAFERRTPLPIDPLSLLIPEGRVEQAQSPALMPGATTVCRCTSVTKKEIVLAWEDGARTAETIAATTRASTGCGGCREVVCGLVDWLNSSDPETPEPSPTTTKTPVDSTSKGA